jgi:hypothetical protein
LDVHSVRRHEMATGQVAPFKTAAKPTPTPTALPAGVLSTAPPRQAGVCDRVQGIRGRHRQGSSSAEKARITIGADGRNSGLTRAVGALSYEETPVRCPITSRFVARGCVESADISSRLALCDRGRLGK